MSRRDSFGGWYKDPHKVFFAKFVERDGCIVRRVFDATDALAWERQLYCGKGARALDPKAYCYLENSWNYLHFCYEWPGTAYERWRINLALARATRACWLETLARDFPERSFSAVVQSAPFAEDSEDGTRIVRVDAITAYLFLWTNRPENDPEFLRCMTDSGDLIAGRDYYPEQFPAEFVFTKQGAIRRSFLRRLNKDRRDRPMPE